MRENLLEPFRRHAPYVALPLVALVAFVFGTCVAGRGDAPPPSSAPAEGEAVEWTCSMHPQVRQSEPGTCPICGMDLIPATSSRAQEGQPFRVTLSTRAKVLAQIRTTEVRRLDTARVERHLLGRVDYDESSLRTVTAWIGGRIDRLHVATTGETVRRGQVIATLYSPEIYAAHQDLLQAHKLASGGRVGTVTLEAARRRLKLVGVPDAELDRMLEAKEPWRHVPIRTPFAGTVVERIATEGSYVTTGAGLYRLADLSQVWVQLDAYETDLPLLAVGQRVRLDVQGIADRVFDGKVAFVDPIIDSRTRTARIRVEVDNGDGALKPGMFAEALVEGRSAAVEEVPLVIPASAPLFTGRRSVVYVEVPGADVPTYDMRVVMLGPKSGTVYPVRTGLEAGERVVTHGAFVLDADLQIRARSGMMSVPDDTEAHVDERLPTTPEMREALGLVLRSYLSLQEALAVDALADAQAAARVFVEGVDAVEPATGRAEATVWVSLEAGLKKSGVQVRDAEGLAAAREAFEPLSERIVTVLERFGNPLEESLHLAFCPMALGSRGASWVQRGQDIVNAYFGPAMATCGEVRDTFTPATEPAPDGDVVPEAGAKKARETVPEAPRRVKPVRREPAPAPAAGPHEGHVHKGHVHEGHVH